MEKNIEISLLLELYKNFLTEKQIQIVDDYYNNDLSLSEIGENLSITRQAVRDNLKNAENKLYDIESKINLLEKRKYLSSALKQISSDLSTLKNKTVDKQDSKLEKLFTNIEKQINNLLNNVI